MRHNLILLLLFCANGVLNGADVDVNCRTRVENLVVAQVKSMHDKMTQHCLHMGAGLYNKLISDDYSPEAARIKVCYQCSQEDFDDAVRTTRTKLITYAITKGVEDRVSLFATPELVSKAIEKVLKQE